MPDLLNCRRAYQPTTARNCCARWEHARVETSAARKLDFDATQTLYVIAATVATIDIIWK